MYVSWHGHIGFVHLATKTPSTLCRFAPLDHPVDRVDSNNQVCITRMACIAILVLLVPTSYITKRTSQATHDAHHHVLHTHVSNSVDPRVAVFGASLVESNPCGVLGIIRGEGRSKKK